MSSNRTTLAPIVARGADGGRTKRTRVKKANFGNCSDAAGLQTLRELEHRLFTQHQEEAVWEGRAEYCPPVLAPVNPMPLCQNGVPHRPVSAVVPSVAAKPSILGRALSAGPSRPLEKSSKFTLPPIQTQHQVPFSTGFGSRQAEIMRIESPSGDIMMEEFPSEQLFEYGDLSFPMCSPPRTLPDEPELIPMDLGDSFGSLHLSIPADLSM